VLPSGGNGACRACGRRRAELLRSFITHYIETRDSEEEYDSWIRAKASRSMATARAGGLVDDEDVEAEFAARRKASLARLAAR